MVVENTALVCTDKHTSKQIQASLMSPSCHGKVNGAHICTRSVALSVMNEMMGQLPSVRTAEDSRSPQTEVIRVLVLTSGPPVDR